MTPPRALRWDLFCHVVDNFGDVGVCWRLACDLAARGDAVRLVIDDASALAWMAPQGAERVEVLSWPGPQEPGDVVVEAFGCALPAHVIHAMAGCGRRVAWFNLEYLSAEPYVERCHGLPSPQAGGLTKWFFYPGFGVPTGGLLREPGLRSAQEAFDGPAWLSRQGVVPRPRERVVSLFCYANEALPQLLHSLAERPTLLLLMPGPAQQQVTQVPPGLRVQRLPWLAQTDFDHLLWASDINFVRGEDSLVRALWAGRAFVWQAYPQDDGAHLAKLDAMLGQWSPPEAVSRLWRAWNAVPGVPWPGLPGADTMVAWQRAVRAWSERLSSTPDLGSQLRAFALGKLLGETTRPAPGKPLPC
jgi:uncharacterized repeat protein (TIGR03837 family)